MKRLPDEDGAGAREHPAEDEREAGRSHGVAERRDLDLRGLVQIKDGEDESDQPARQISDHRSRSRPPGQCSAAYFLITPTSARKVFCSSANFATKGAYSACGMKAGTRFAASYIFL